MLIILFLAIFILIIIGFNRFMGYRKHHIIVDLDERYTNYGEYIKAIQSELVKKGRNVYYEGNGNFIVDERPYFFIEKNLSIGGVPLQRTILKPKRNI